MIESSLSPGKVCGACGVRYADDALFCPTDGTSLQSAAERGADDPYIGQEISGHIEIRQLVGVGAMGRVYRAFQRGIDRDVAVKILHRELSANAQLVSRFTREAKVASRLQHPNVVQVLLAGQLPDRALYMVMEYLDGLSLLGALTASDGTFPLPRALRIVLQLCDAVGEAHVQGIVHRDLKPENVMLVHRGSDPDYVKVLDFGIARINWGEQSVATAAGLIFGTARYISPEGAQGNPVGPASDVYSIATLLYQMLSGRTPFDGDQAVGLLVQQIHDPAPPLRSLPRAGHVPEPIADVVMAGLRKDPSTREPDARAFGQALFDAAQLAGLSPDEFSRPILKRNARAVAATTPGGEPARHARDAAASEIENGAAHAKDRPPTVSTVKWEPPSEYQVSFGGSAKPSSAELPRGDADRGGRRRSSSNVDETIDDMRYEQQAQGVVFFPTPLPTSERAKEVPSPAPIAERSPAVPTPVPVAARAPRAKTTPPLASHEASRTVPGDADGPIRTQYTPPLVETMASASDGPARRARARSEGAPARSSGVVAAGGQSRNWLLVVLCFVLGATIALGWAWKVGKIGAGDAHDKTVARATDAMFKNHFHEPPGENVKDITDDGLRRWPNDQKLLDIRVRAANELTSQALAQRAAGDVVEALRLAKSARELDPHDAVVRRLVEQYEAELALVNTSAAPTLSTPPLSVPVPSSPPKAPTTVAGIQSSTSSPAPSRVQHKAVVDVSVAAPRLGQTVEWTARVTPSKGEFDEPAFVIVGPGVPGGVRMAAHSSSAGVFKASYAFLEPGKFDVTFTVHESGRPISAKRSLSVVSPPPPEPSPPAPSSSPTPTGTVKWM